MLAVTLFTLPLSGCDWMQEHVGRHMPVIGDRCDNWQCFTSSGEADSEAKKHMSSSGSATRRTPLNGEQNTPASAPSQPPLPKTPTPFDMTPDQLENAPTTYGAQEQ